MRHDDTHSRPRRGRRSATENRRGPKAAIVPQGEAFNLPEALRAKIGSNPLVTSAKTIGVNVLSLRKVLEGKSTPNKRTVGKYAKFLQVNPEVILNPLASPVLARGRQSRPAIPSSSPAAHLSKAHHALDVVRNALKQSEDPILQDDLAQRTHTASRAKRELIQRILDLSI